MPRAPVQLLAELESVARRYDVDASPRKRELLAALGRARFRSAAALLRLHEVACFLCAHPDDPSLLAAVERLLAGFESRSDLKRERDALRDSGIAGTAIHFPFHWVTARWLLARWPERLHVDWPAFGEREAERFRELLPLLLPYAEYPDFELVPSAADWLARLGRAGETDAAFLIRRFEALSASPRVREGLFHDLRMPFRLDPGPGGPSRSRALYSGAPRAFQRVELSRTRPDLLGASRRKPIGVRELSRREATKVIDLAREAMLTRSRDLDGIMYASPDDVRLVDAGDGLGLACLGLLPEQRALVETIYVFLLLKNGVPIGYYQAALLFGSAELNYNVFPSFRGGETAEVYARSLGVVRALFGANAFSVHPYQLGHENPEALASGAFWFYEKLGFRPEHPRVLSVLARERRRMAKTPKHRSSPKVLAELATEYLFFYLGRPRKDVAGKVSLSRIALAASEELGRRFGSERERGVSECSREVARALDVSLTSLSRGERLWWERWAPLVACLRTERWSRAEKRALVELVRAKAGRREQEFAHRLDRHARLRRALLGLARLE